MHSVFTDISLILAITIGLAFIVQTLRQPLIISYILTGIICGPLFFNLINSNAAFFDIFAQLGVILLLFLVGLSLNLDYLRQIGKVAVITGVGQVIFTSFFGLLILMAMGYDFAFSIYLAISITFSSTIIIMKLLSDKRDLQTVYGRYTMGLMLVQDIIAILIMIILPTLNMGDQLVEALLMLFAKAILVVSLVYFLAKIILPIVLERAAQNGEFLLIFTLAWCFAIAGLGEWSGLSIEVGAIIAGLTLGSSEFQTEISSRIKPLRDFFIAMFFIILGSEMNIGNIGNVIWPGVVLSVFVLVGNPFILYKLYRSLKFTRSSSFMAGLTAAQVSEFGFVFLFVAQQSGHINGEVMSIFTIVALITIFVSSYLITYNHLIYRYCSPLLKLFGKDKYKSLKEENKCFDVLIFGYHRLGWRICEILQEMKVSFAVVDFDPSVVHKLQKRNIPHIFGDATDVELLKELSLENVKMIISTFPRADDQVTLIRYARKKNKKAYIIANLSHIKFLDSLYNAGADYVMIPHLISAEWVSDLIKNNKWSKKLYRDLKKDQIRELRARLLAGDIK